EPLKPTSALPEWLGDIEKPSAQPGDKPKWFRHPLWQGDPETDRGATAGSLPATRQREEPAASLSAALQPTASAQQPAAGGGVTHRLLWGWLAGVAVCAAVFGTVIVLVAWVVRPPQESEHRSAAATPDQHPGQADGAVDPLSAFFDSRRIQ